MSKALRVATDEMSTWHPVYASKHPEVPCFHEFATLVSCIQTKAPTACKKEYDDLVACLWSKQPPKDKPATSTTARDPS